MIVSIVGARPQFIKLAPLAKELSGRFRHRIIHTGQHFDDNMSDVFFRQLHIPKPHQNLGVGGGSHGRMTGRMLTRIEATLIEHRPNCVIVYGDTNSTLAGALAAAKLSIPVVHVEAGMRSYEHTMPEEINRKLTDHVSDLLLCPTRTAVQNLKQEAVRKRIVHTGDVMYELLDSRRGLIRSNTRLLDRLSLKRDRYLLLTVHRAGTVDTEESLARLLDVLGSLPLPTLFPIHPRTRKRFRQYGLWQQLRQSRHLIVTEPIGYLDVLTAARYAHAVLTDSGGLQKEALFLGTPVLILRNTTEWIETLRRGNHLVGLSRRRILQLLRSSLKVKPIAYRIRGKRPSQIIAGELVRLTRP